MSLEFSPGDLIDGHECVRLLGAGGFGVVYEVLDAAGRRFALKVLKANVRDTRAIQRVLQEMVLLRNLRHPHIVELKGGGWLSETQPYILMEYLDGVPLRQWMHSRGMLPIDVVLRMGVQICSALGCAHAHEPPIIHRDIKPENIFVLAGGAMVKVLDFGLARVGRGLGTTQTMGTALYMCPEQLEDETPPEPSWDLWALGVVLWEAVAGRHPRALDDGSIPKAALIVKEQIQRKPMPALASSLPGISPRVAACLDRAVALAPEHRFHAARELGAELDELAAWYAKVTVAVPPNMPMELHEITAWRPPPRAGSGEVPIGEGEKREAMWALADGQAGLATTERARGSFGTDVLPDPDAHDGAGDAPEPRRSPDAIPMDTDVHIDMIVGSIEEQLRRRGPRPEETAPLSPDALGTDHPVQRRIAALERAAASPLPIHRLPPGLRPRPSGWTAPVLGRWPRWIAALFAIALCFAAALFYLRGPQPLVLVMAGLVVAAIVATALVPWWDR